LTGAASQSLKNCLSQDLLTDMASMASNVSLKADAAAQLFSKQVAATGTLSIAAGAALAAVRESNARAASLLDAYIGQNALLAQWTGSGASSNCTRTSYWETHFDVPSR